MIYDKFNDYIFHTILYIRPTLVRDIGPTTWLYYLKKYVGQFTVDYEMGFGVDTIYQELCEVFPYLFENDIINEHDQLLKILETIDAARRERDDQKSKAYRGYHNINS